MDFDSVAIDDCHLTDDGVGGERGKGREGETIRIRVDEKSGQIVSDEHRRAQWVLTFSFAAMALIGALGLSWMVGGWNRFLKREGDPGERTDST